MKTVTIPKSEYDDMVHTIAMFEGYRIAVETLAPSLGYHNPSPCTGEAGLEDFTVHVGMGQ